MNSVTRRLLLIAAAALIFSPIAAAYVDMAPTLGSIVRNAQKIALVEVDKSSQEKGAIILKKVRDLKGTMDDQPIKHRVITQDQTIPRHILEWAEPGQRAVLFTSSNISLVCLGPNWYQVRSASDGWWELGANRPDLPLAFCGTVSRLSDAVELIVAGKTAVITMVPHGTDGAASVDLALNRTSLPGFIRVQRIRANLRMPPMTMAVSANPAYLVGSGAAGEAEIPLLIAKLSATDATVRREAAEDLRTLGSHASAAVPALERLLSDPVPAVRMSAAAALLRIAPGSAKAIDVLTAGLGSSDAAVRRHAARAAGLAGPSASLLAGRLAGLLVDSDALVRLAALDAVATLGPAAADAMSGVMKLLDDQQMEAGAADALGRMGPAARPAQKRLAQLLTSESKDVRWAAVRAMSQIGGDDAAPAVQFMIKELRSASDVDGYNMAIYLALLGPVAKDAADAIQQSRIRQPALRPAALWAMEPDKRFPWQGGNEGPGGFGGPRGGRFGAMSFEADVVVGSIYECLVNEMGEHLRPAAKALARRIMDGTAGEVPLWGYKILARYPEDALPTLLPALADGDVVKRERAAVALGYMSGSGAPARAEVEKALLKAPTEREQRLLKWCLREIGNGSAKRS